MGNDIFEERVELFNRGADIQMMAEKFNTTIRNKEIEEEEWETYSSLELQELLDITEDEARKLLKSGLFKVYRAGNEYRAKKKSVEENEKIVSAMLNYQKKQTMTVRDMSRILGLGKTAAYRLIGQDHFKKFLVFGKIRIDVESFEDWYAGQFHYKKVNGEKPGMKYGDTIPPIAMAKVLGIPKSTANDLMNNGLVDFIRVDGKRRVIRESFEAWYASQSKYTKIYEEIPEVDEDDEY